MNDAETIHTNGASVATAIAISERVLQDQADREHRGTEQDGQSSTDGCGQ